MINEAEAIVVRRIFAEYAGPCSPTNVRTLSPATYVASVPVNLTQHRAAYSREQDIRRTSLVSAISDSTRRSNLTKRAPSGPQPTNNGTSKVTPRRLAL